MDLTVSYQSTLPDDVRSRYEIRETRNAAAILAATNPIELDEIIGVLREFSLTNNDILKRGGNKSLVAARIDQRFRVLGWREGRFDTKITSVLRLMPYNEAGEMNPVVRETEVYNEGYKVDNVKGRVALDVEWNAKDGNLDRDLSVYRALYDSGIIDAGVLITRTQDDLRELARRLGLRNTSGILAPGLDETAEVSSSRGRLSTTTTTNLKKLEPRLTRGDGGGCPILAVAITARCFTT